MLVALILALLGVLLLAPPLSTNARTPALAAGVCMGMGAVVLSGRLSLFDMVTGLWAQDAATDFAQLVALAATVLAITLQRDRPHDAVPPGALVLAAAGACALASATHAATAIAGEALLAVALGIMLRAAGQELAGLVWTCGVGIAATLAGAGVLMWVTHGAALDRIAIGAGASPRGPLLAGVGVLLCVGLSPFTLLLPGGVWLGRSRRIPAALLGWILSVLPIAGTIPCWRLTRSLHDLEAVIGSEWRSVLAALAVISLCASTWQALRQRCLRRLWCWLGIGNASLFAFGLAAGAPGAHVEAALAGHACASLIAHAGAGAVLTMAEGWWGGNTRLQRFVGLGQRNAFLGVALGGFLGLLSAIPFTAGFFPKLHLMLAGQRGGLTWLVVPMALGLTWVGLVALRTARVLFHVKEKGRAEPLVGSPGLTLLVGLLGCAALGLGVRPLTVAWGY
ncbi:MAG: hypothetical protein KDD82_04745 [Planctomycetes bacterium]|nr:hypothetical protein [Planctomycetota bacterium]